MNTIHGLDDAVLLCRTLGHAWDPIPYDGMRRDGYNIERSVRMMEFRCTRCHTLRYEAWSKVTGDFLFRDYVYENADEYRLAKDDSARTDMRAEFLRRWDPKKEDAPRLRVVRNNGSTGNGNGKRASSSSRRRVAV